MAKAKVETKKSVKKPVKQVPKGSIVGAKSKKDFLNSL